MPDTLFRLLNVRSERFLFVAKRVKGECNDKSGKRSFTGDGIAEPHPILCKDSVF